MDAHKLALTDVVKSLGFNNSTAVSNKVRDILKAKEGFKDRFIIDERSDFESENRRTEKTYVSPKAKVLIDNLAILLQYSGLFGRGTSTTFPAYRELLKGIDDNFFKSNVIKHTQTIKQNIELSKSSLKELPIFYNAVLNKKIIDITKDSLRELMQIHSNNGEILDLTNTFKLSAWNELLEYQNELENNDQDSTLYQKIGEKFFELGDHEQALTALITSTELDPKNGISWAISSLIFHSRLRERKNSHYQALARNDFSESIAHPITSEEHWVNERIEDTYSDIIDVNSQFVTSAINALVYWPVWEYSKTEEKPNYFYNLNQSHDTNVEVERRYLFIKLINEISFNQFGRHKSEMVDIVRTFQGWDPKSRH
jgi:tetratricopeptide (TPR) repeat protein